MRSIVSCTGQDASPHPASGQWKREPGPYPIVMRGFRPPASVSRNSTSVTCQGSTSCRAAADSIVVSMPPKLPDRRHRLTRFTHTKQRKAILILLVYFLNEMGSKKRRKKYHTNRVGRALMEAYRKRGLSVILLALLRHSYSSGLRHLLC